MSLRIYIAMVLSTTCLVLGLCLLFNWRVDPYGIYQIQTAESLSRIDQFRFVRRYKSVIADRLKPSSLILGSSIAARMNPDTVEWAAPPAYNYSLPGMTEYEAYRLLKHSNLGEPVSEVVLALDFHASFANRPKLRLGFPLARLREEHGDDRSQEYLGSLLRMHRIALLSNSSLVRSLQASTRADTRVSPNGAIYLQNGSWDRPRLSNRQARFRDIGKHYREPYLENVGEVRLDVTKLEPLLSYCYAQDIALRIVINPLHLVQLENTRRAQVFDLWQEFHHSLLATNAGIAKRFNHPGFPVYGFNTYEAAVSESLDANQLGDNPWFEDGMHYTPRLGEFLLRNSGSASPYLLSQGNIESYISSTVKLLDDYGRENQAELNRVLGSRQPARQKKPG